MSDTEAKFRKIIAICHIRGLRRNMDDSIRLGNYTITCKPGSKDTYIVQNNAYYNFLFADAKITAVRYDREDIMQVVGFLKTVGNIFPDPGVDSIDDYIMRKFQRLITGKGVCIYSDYIISRVMILDDWTTTVRINGNHTPIVKAGDNGVVTHDYKDTDEILKFLGKYTTN